MHDATKYSLTRTLLQIVVELSIVTPLAVVVALLGAAHLARSLVARA